MSGKLNNVDIDLAQMTVRFSNNADDAVKLMGVVDGASSDVGYLLKVIANSISPIYWLAAYEEVGTELYMNL